MECGRDAADDEAVCDEEAAQDSDEKILEHFFVILDFGEGCEKDVVRGAGEGLDGIDGELLCLGIEAECGWREVCGEQEFVNLVEKLRDCDGCELISAEFGELLYVAVREGDFRRPFDGDGCDEPSDEALCDDCDCDGSRAEAADREDQGGCGERHFAGDIADGEVCETEFALKDCVGDDGKGVEGEGECGHDGEAGGKFERAFEKRRAEDNRERDDGGRGDDECEHGLEHRLGCVFFLDERSAEAEICQGDRKVDADEDERHDADFCGREPEREQAYRDESERHGHGAQAQACDQAVKYRFEYVHGKLKVSKFADWEDVIQYPEDGNVTHVCVTVTE